MQITARGKVVFVFRVYVKVRSFQKKEKYSFVSIKKKNICKKKVKKIWYNSGLHKYLRKVQHDLHSLASQIDK